MKLGQYRQGICFIVVIMALGYSKAGLAEPVVRMQTSVAGLPGQITIQLYDGVTPITVKNFLQYSSTGAYDNTFIHRSIVDFIVQGGGFYSAGVNWGYPLLSDVVPPTYGPIRNEPFLSNVRGTIAMAKTPAEDGFGNPITGGGPDSATTEWFINVVDNNDANNSLSLDNQNGGFTVFGEVTAGMDVVDQINGLDTSVKGGAFNDIPLVDYPDDTVDPVLSNMVLIDSVYEDANEDFIPDKNQTHVISMWNKFDRYLSFVSPAGSIITATEIESAALTSLIDVPPYYDANGQMAIEFTQGMQEITIENVGSTVTITLKFPENASPASYFMYGPTPGDTTDHWHEFNFDGTTGAVINGNIVSLYLVDGGRGDSDLTGNNIITIKLGAAVQLLDVNSDNVDDASQGYIFSIWNRLYEIVTFIMQDIDNTVVAKELDPDTLAATIGSPVAEEGVIDFFQGQQSIRIENIVSGNGEVTVEIRYPEYVPYNSYYIYGPTPDDVSNHWYKFSYDPGTNTGAVISGNIVTLHLVDGGRGDSDPNLGIIEIYAGGPSQALTDANKDGIADKDQPHVTSILVSSVPIIRRIAYVAPEGTSLAQPFRIVDLEGYAKSLGDPNMVSFPTDYLVNFFEGIQKFTVTDISSGDGKVIVTIIYPEGIKPSSYYIYGPTPDNPYNHWYEFTYDSVTNTGAVISNNIVMLYLVDGFRGDYDQEKNNEVAVLGGIVLATPLEGGTVDYSSAGCMLSQDMQSVKQAGGWSLIILFLVALRLHSFYSVKMGD